MSLYFIWGVHPLDGKKPPNERRNVKIWKYDFVANGRRYAGSFGKVSQTRAKELYVAKHAEMLEARHGIPAAKRRPRTVRDVAEEFYAWYQMDRRPSTVQRWAASWKAIEPLIGARLMRDVTSKDLEHIQQVLRRTKRPGTVNKDMAALRHLLHRAQQWGDLTHDPARPVANLRVPRRQPRILTQEEEARLLGACPPRLRPVVITALLTGLRRNELRQLRWRDVDFSRGIIRIPPEINKTDAVTSQPMPTALIHVLQPLQDAPDALVFGYRLFDSVFRRAVARAGITPRCTFHDLRKTFGSRLAMAGVNLRTVQELLRHQRLGQTEIYVHLMPSFGRQAVEQLPSPPTTSPTAPALRLLK